MCVCASVCILAIQFNQEKRQSGNHEKKSKYQGRLATVFTTIVFVLGQMGIIDWIFVSLMNSYVDALTPNVTIFGDRVCEQVMKVKWGYKNGALIF